MRRPGAAAAAVLVVVLLLAGLVSVPFLTEDRRLAAAIPQPPPLFGVELIEVPAGSRACLGDITIDERAEVAEIKVATFGAPPVPFTLALEGPGYRATARSPAYVDNDTVALGVAEPARTLRGRACVRNDGRARLALYAAADRTRRGAVTVDGRRVDPSFQLAFYERAPASIADRLPEIAERMATFRPVDPWLVWLVGVLVAIGVPAALVLAVARAAREG